MQKLVEQLLKGIESNLKRELFYWHAYYVTFFFHRAFINRFVSSYIPAIYIIICVFMINRIRDFHQELQLY